MYPPIIGVSRGNGWSYSTILFLECLLALIDANDQCLLRIQLLTLDCWRLFQHFCPFWAPPQRTRGSIFHFSDAFFFFARCFLYSSGYQKVGFFRQKKRLSSTTATLFFHTLRATRKLLFFTKKKVKLNNRHLVFLLAR